MTRQDYNKQILEKLMEYCIQYPDIRFQQMLWNVGIIESEVSKDGSHKIIDQYNEESSKTLNKMK